MEISKHIDLKHTNPGESYLNLNIRCGTKHDLDPLPSIDETGVVRDRKSYLCEYAKRTEGALGRALLFNNTKGKGDTPFGTRPTPRFRMIERGRGRGKFRTRGETYIRPYRQPTPQWGNIWTLEGDETDISKSETTSCQSDTIFDSTSSITTDINKEEDKQEEDTTPPPLHTPQKEEEEEEEEEEEPPKKEESSTSRITNDMKYTIKSQYNPLDIIWCQLKGNQWTMCIVQYLLSRDQMIVRPLGSTETNERKIDANQIGCPELDVKQLRQCIEAMKQEIHIAYNHRAPISQGSLVRCKPHPQLFGDVLLKDTAGGTYTIKMRRECKESYHGPRIFQLARDEIEACHESELKHALLEANPRPTRYDNDALAVYDFLDDLGDLYIDRFLENGITSMTILTCMTHEDLKAMKVTLGHRRYIMCQLKKFDAQQFQFQRRKMSNNESHERSSRQMVKNGIQHTKCNIFDLSPVAKEKGLNQNIKLVVYSFDHTMTTLGLYDELLHQTNDSKTEQLNVLSQTKHERLLSVFGGQYRIDLLKQHLELLQLNGVAFVLITFNYTNVIERVLREVGLYESYFDHALIIGCDSDELRNTDGCMVQCIANTFKKGTDLQRLAGDEILFVDNDWGTIKCADQCKVCKTIQFDTDGLKARHMQCIEDTITFGC
eukprot:211789_1